MSNFVSIDPGMIIWVWVTFGFLLLLMGKYAWKPILNAIESRESYVRDTLDKANRTNEEAQLLFENHQKLIANSEKEAHKLLKESRELADKMRDDVLKKARDEASEIMDKAMIEIENQKNSAKVELQGLVADLSINIAEKLINEKLDGKKQHQLIDSYIEEMSKKN